jgi:hypothetical protein
MEGGLRMSRSRIIGLAVVTVGLLTCSAGVAPAQFNAQSVPLEQLRLLAQVVDDLRQCPQQCQQPPANNGACVVHPLGTLADDPKFGKWIVDTIPQMIQPGTWNASRRISYYAPGRLLVVSHTPAVQTEIKTFLADMQKAAGPAAASAGNSAAPDRHVVPATLTDVQMSQPRELVAGTRGAYPVPAPVRPPKHLFHLIIRYEGDGLGDVAIAGLMSQLGSADTSKQDGEKAAPSADKDSTLGQLLHFIVRYEGDGIIDENVASLLRDIYGAKAGSPFVPPNACPAPSSYPLSTTSPPPPTSAPVPAARAKYSDMGPAPQPKP